MCYEERHLELEEIHSPGRTNVLFRAAILQSLSKLNVLLEICSSIDSCKYVCRELPSKKLKQNPDRFSDSISFKDSAPQGGACAAIPSRICLPRALQSCQNLLYGLPREHSALELAQLAGEKHLMRLSPNLTLLSMPLINFINY